ncbi:MAG: hypothetical protein CND86_00725 [Bacteroidetes bacterium MED-G21]|nr:MAG: hypothetical protein CND86_00725 [Bacteroidetes bacterium MED-G21]
MKYTLRSIAILAVVVLFTACKKEWNELGSQLVVSDDLEVFSFDDQEIKISTVREDSLSTLNRPTSFIGSIQDPYFGNTTASLYTEFRIPSTDVDFGSSAQADSIVLYLDIASYYGDTLSPLSISVREMLETIETTTTEGLDVESSVNIYSTDDFDFDPQLLNEPQQTLQSIVNSELKVKLSNTFAQHILDADTANYTDNDAFQSLFNGLYVSADQGPGSGLLLELDLLAENSKLTIYYHNETSDSLSYDFQINSSTDRMTRWAHDYSATEIETALDMEYVSQSYVQGSVGLRTYIELPDLKSLKDSNYVFHSAELTIPYISTEADSIFSSPEKLGLAAVNSDGNLEVLTEDQNVLGSSYFDGNKNESAQTYTFNIARYIHKVVQEGYSNRLALYVPISVSQPERVIINNHSVDSVGLRLNLLVSH